MSQPTAALSQAGNKASATALRLLDALLFRNPERTAIGVAVGLAIDGIVGVFWPLLASKGIHLGRPDWWASVSIGLVLVHLPFVIWPIRNKPLINDELESLMQLIESTNIGELEKQAAYRKLVNKCIDDFSLSASPGKIKSDPRSEVEAVPGHTE
jgi:hypothetical protein